MAKRILPDLSGTTAPAPAPETTTRRNAARDAGWSALGKRGIMYATIDGDLVFRVPMDKASRKSAPLSASGGNQTIASSGGLISVPGIDGAKVNLVVTVPVDQSNAELAGKAEMLQAAYKAAKQAAKSGLR